MKLALFDLDGTLLDGDTDELWCAFLIEEGVLDRAAFEPRNRDVVARYKAGSIGPAEFCAFYASTLAGRTREAWSAQRARFVETWVLPCIGSAARALVARHRDIGEKVLLTTATNRFLTEPIAESLGFAADELIATELETRDGVFTGANAGVLNMREGKVTRLAAWLEAHGQRDEAMARAIAEASFYSDSANDLPLLRAVARAIVVDPDATLRREAVDNGWQILMLPR